MEYQPSLPAFSNYQRLNDLMQEPRYKDCHILRVLVDTFCRHKLIPTAHRYSQICPRLILNTIWSPLNDIHEAVFLYRDHTYRAHTYHAHTLPVSAMWHITGNHSIMGSDAHNSGQNVTMDTWVVNNPGQWPLQSNYWTGSSSTLFIDE